MYDTYVSGEERKGKKASTQGQVVGGMRSDASGQTIQIKKWKKN